MSGDPLIGPKSKIEWAKGHLLDLEKTISTYERGNPYGFAIEVDPTGTNESVKLRLNPIPPIIGVMTGNVIYNFRASLDLLTCALARKNGATIVSDVYFPFAGNREEFERSGPQRKIQRLSQDAR